MQFRLIFFAHTGLKLVVTDILKLHKLAERGLVELRLQRIVGLIEAISRFLISAHAIKYIALGIEFSLMAFERRLVEFAEQFIRLIIVLARQVIFHKCSLHAVFYKPVVDGLERA